MARAVRLGACGRSCLLAGVPGSAVRGLQPQWSVSCQTGVFSCPCFSPLSPAGFPQLSREAADGGSHGGPAHLTGVPADTRGSCILGLRKLKTDGTFSAPLLLWPPLATEKGQGVDSGGVGVRVGHPAPGFTTRPVVGKHRRSGSLGLVPLADGPHPSADTAAHRAQPRGAPPDLGARRLRGTAPTEATSQTEVVRPSGWGKQGKRPTLPHPPGDPQASGATLQRV